MTVQLEKFEEIVGVVNSMKQGFKQLDIKVEKVQVEMSLLKEKLLADQNKLLHNNKIQAVDQKWWWRLFKGDLRR